MSNPNPCPEAERLAAYVAGVLSEEMRTDLESHFVSCDKCRKRLKELMSLSSIEPLELAHVSIPEARQRLDKQIAEWGERKDVNQLNEIGRVIPLRIRDDKKEKQLIEDRLAATSLVLDPTEVTTFASENGAIIAKLQGDYHGEYSLFIISEDSELVVSASIRVINQEIEYIKEEFADEFGVVSLGRIDGLNPKRTTIDVVLPDATFRLESRDEMHRLVGDTEYVLNSPIGASLRVDLDERGIGREYRLDLSNIASKHPTARIRAFTFKPGSKEPLSIGPNGIAVIPTDVADTENTVIHIYVEPS